MNCLFCQQSSANSKSVEHIVPESLGNKQFILDKGWVCDKCNNYIAIKIEQPVLQMPFFSQHRHDLDVESKKGKIPSKKGFLLDDQTSGVTLHKDKNKKERIEIDKMVVDQLLAEGVGDGIPLITVEFAAPPNDIYVSKLLGKMAIEFWAYKAMINNWDDFSYNQECFNSLKNYVRKGRKDEFWPYTARPIYNSEAGFKDDTGYFKVVFTCDFILTQEQQLLFQFLFVGTEFTINMINPNTQSILQWFKENNNRSVTFDNLMNQYGSKD